MYNPLQKIVKVGTIHVEPIVPTPEPEPDVPNPEPEIDNPKPDVDPEPEPEPTLPPGWDVPENDLY